jgi:Uma2 family endonuclease
LFGAPDLVIEVLSPETRNNDFGAKKYAYEKYGVKEYWLIDPETKEVYFFNLVNDVFVEVPSSKGTIESPLLQTIINF